MQCDPEASPCCKRQDATMSPHAYLEPGGKKEREESDKAAGRVQEGGRFTMHVITC